MPLERHSSPRLTSIANFALFSQTPMQFLQERRLAAACRFLTTTDEPITNVCLSVGLESLGSFCWLFRKRFGCSPGQYRTAAQVRPKIAVLKKRRARPRDTLLY